jgi:hypothetical protein
MQSQPPSNPELSIEEMERVMESIETETSTPKPAAESSPLKTFISAEKLREDVSIDKDNLDDGFINQASLFVHYANLKANARMQYEKMKAAFEILESRLYAQYRASLAAAAIAEAGAAASEGKKEKTVKAPTEAQIDAAVKADPRWWANKKRVIEAQGIYDLATNTASAFEQRRDMLIQMGSDRREEMKGQLRTIENTRERTAAGLRAAAG